MDMVLSFLISAGIIAFGVWVVVGKKTILISIRRLMYPILRTEP